MMMYNGINIYISDTHKVRVKTHKNPIIDWLYKLIYGWKDVPCLETDFACIRGVGIIVRDEEVLHKLKEVIENL